MARPAHDRAVPARARRARRRRGRERQGEGLRSSGLSLFAAVLIAWTFASLAVSDDSMGTDRIYVLGLIVLLFAARTAWLYRSYVGRRCALDAWEVPTSAVLTLTRRAVDVRSAVESFALGLTVYLQPVAWYRLSAQLARLEASVARSWAGETVFGRFVSLPAAAAVIFFAPPLLAVGSGASSGSRPPAGVRRVSASSIGATAGSSSAGCCRSSHPSTVPAGSLVVRCSDPRRGARVRGCPGGAEPPRPVVRRAGAGDIDGAVPAAGAVRFNPAPGWPAPPPGQSPQPGWQPDASWPQPPKGWRLWTPVTAVVPSPSAADG